MKKTLLVAALLALSSAAARAATGDGNTSFAASVRSPEPATNVTIVKSSDIIVGVSITTQTPTSIVLDVTQAYRWVNVQNTGASDIVCGENSVTISTTAATLSGWTVQASTGVMKFDIVPGTDFFCQSKSQSAATRVSVYRGR